MNDQIVTLTRPGVRPAASQSTKQESTFPTETINIPSKGWFYSSDSPLSAGTLELKPMTAREEDILTSKNLIQKGIVLDKVLESLIVEKAIHSEDMLNCDRNAAFVAIRRMAYGDEYKANITCPKCGVDNSLTIDLGKMDNKPFDFEKYPKGTNEFEFTLPVSKRVVTFKLLTKKDEDAIDADLKALTKISKEVTSEITTRLKSYIIALDGNADKSAIRKFVDEMRAGDSLALRNYVRTMTPDVDMSFDFVCSSCGVERREDVPLSVSFFWPNG
jgi:rubredoxin